MGWIAKYGRYSAKDAVERGRTRIGQPYVWGSWDCSAFVSWCYFDSGTRWSTSAMASVNAEAYGFTRIPISEAGAWQPGDILYYDNGDPYDSHTGMATGPGWVIQNSGGVGEHQNGNGRWQYILRPKEAGLYIEHWEPIDGLGGGF